MKNYTQPTIDVENFEANEYVAACYAFNCDVSGKIYEDSNKNGKLDIWDDQIGTNEPCGATFSTDELKGIKKAFDSKGNAVFLFTDESGTSHAVHSVSSTDNHS